MEQKRFGRYVVLGELGRGAMGMVYRAVDPIIEREVAVKTLLPNLRDEVMAESRERFLREARSAGRLNHPNIVTIHDVGEEDGTAYIAMELLDGRTLQDMLLDAKRMPFATIADIAAQVADALDHAKRFGIVHRDVKPANIVVSASGCAKLADFGVAHVPSSSMTLSGASLGSPRYMSPEQVLGQPVDPRSDIFSLGVVLYEMLVGSTPFERPGDTTVFALMNRVAGETHRPVHEVDPGIPAAFDRILAHALAKSPAERYERAGDMANDLRNLDGLAAGGASAPPVGGTSVLRRAARTYDTDAEKTVLRPPAVGRPAVTPESAKAGAELIADLDAFSGAFEAEEQARLREEQEARARKQEELRRWGEEEEKRRTEFERQRDSTTQGAQGIGRRASGLELLRQRASGQTAEQDKAKKVAVTASIDNWLREAFRSLSEFTVELNAARPVSERPYAVLYFGEVTGAILSDGFTDSRTRSLGDKDVIDYVTFKYRVRSPRPMKIDLTGQELPRVRERLDRRNVQYQCVEAKNEFAQVVRATLTTSGPFPCQAVLRGDYDGAGILIELDHVRRAGASQIRLGADELTAGVLDELSTYLLGVDDAFERFLKRR
jgi:hypothetical protein